MGAIRFDISVDILKDLLHLPTETTIINIGDFDRYANRLSITLEHPKYKARRVPVEVNAIVHQERVWVTFKKIKKGR